MLETSSSEHVPEPVLPLTKPHFSYNPDVPDLSLLKNSEIDQLHAYIMNLLWLQTHGTEKQFQKAYLDLWQDKQAQWLDVPQFDYKNESAAKHDESAKKTPQKEEPKDLFGKIGAVLGDIGGGIVDEALHNPLGLVKDAAIGVGVAVGAAFLAPEIVVGAAVVGVTAGAAQLATNGGKWLHAADIVASGEGHTEEEKAAAHKELHGLGCGAAHFTAGIAGGGLGTVGVNLAKSAAAVEAESAAAAAKDETIGPFAHRSPINRQDAYPKAITDQRPAAVERMPQPGESGVGPEDKAITRERPKVIDRAEKTSGIDPKEANAITQDQSILDAKRAHRPIEAFPAADDVSVESPAPNKRIYKVGEKEYGLEKGKQAWFVGRKTRGSGDVKIHVNVDSPEDLAKIQKVLIPYLEEEPFISNRVAGWKTFDPEIGLGKSEDTFVPDGIGQGAKGFTIYTRSASDSFYLGKKIDKLLMEAGLGRKAPIETGNVDTMPGLSNRVGIVRDHFRLAYPEPDVIGPRLDWEVVKKLTDQYGGKLDDAALRAVEKEVGLMPQTLKYDAEGYLMLQSKGSHVTGGDRVYVPEATEGHAIPGKLTDRHAIYALYRKYGIDPSDTTPNW